MIGKCHESFWLLVFSLIIVENMLLLTFLAQWLVLDVCWAVPIVFRLWSWTPFRTFWFQLRQSKLIAWGSQKFVFVAGVLHQLWRDKGQLLFEIILRLHLLLLVLWVEWAIVLLVCDQQLEFLKLIGVAWRIWQNTADFLGLKTLRLGAVFIDSAKFWDDFQLDVPESVVASERWFFKALQQVVLGVQFGGLIQTAASKRIWFVKAVVNCWFEAILVSLNWREFLHLVVAYYGFKTAVGDLSLVHRWLGVVLVIGLRLLIICWFNELRSICVG